MKRLYWMCILSLGVVVTTVYARALPELRGGPLLSCSGMPCVDVALKNGKHLRMLVDLGDSESIVDSIVAKDLGLSIAPAEAAGRDGKPKENFGSAVLEGAGLGGVSLGDVPVLVTDIDSGMKKGDMPQADGILAYTAFRDRLLQIDFKGRMVRASGPLTTKLDCAGSCGDLTLPTFGKQGPPVLVTTGFSVNGKPLTAQIDTLYTGTMLIYPNSVAKLNLQAESAANPTQMFRYTDGGVAMRESHAKSESFKGKLLAHNGALFFATPQVHVPDGMFDGTVGLGLLNGHVVYIDLHSQHFWLTN